MLVMVVVLGALAAGAVVGMQAMTGSDSGSPTAVGQLTPTTNHRGGGSALSNLARNACLASADGARAASAAFFASSGAQRYPTTWSEMTAPSSGAFALASGDVISSRNPRELDGQGWRLIIAGGGATAPTFTCH
jgi:hypothetical protein